MTKKNQDRFVHFFLYDYKFERVWSKPDRDFGRLRRYRAVLSPDFSMYLEMNPTIQLYNTFRNRWCGAYYQSKGLRVIPTISWGDEGTFDFCFRGIPKGSTVAVSTYMVSEHGNRRDQKEFFLKGYREMLRQIEPERIVCYHTPFPEMEGNIVFVDYELSSWKYQEKSLNDAPFSPYTKYISGHLPLPEACGILIKQGCVLSGTEEKGMGSAFGGQWKPDPRKPQDMALKGPPNSVHRIRLQFAKEGYWIVVKYNEKGDAIIVRHETQHSPGSNHTNPHDHLVQWVEPDHHPHFWKRIDYPNGDVPTIKDYRKRDVYMDANQMQEANRFHTIHEFKQSIAWGGEVVILWQDEEIGIWAQDDAIRITCAGKPEKEATFHSVDEALEYVVGQDRLRDVITKATVLDRAI